MPWKKRPKYGLKFWGLVIALCVLAGFAAFGTARFLESFYSYVPSAYEPKDMSRGKHLEKDTGSGQ